VEEVLCINALKNHKQTILLIFFPLVLLVITIRQFSLTSYVRSRAGDNTSRSNIFTFKANLKI
jgi:hypothetical protein